MKIRHIAFALTTVGLITGCTTSSGVVPIGQNTYMISRTHKTTRGSAALVKGEALQEANEYCIKHGKVMKLIKTTQTDMKPFKSDAAAEVYFKALDPGDPEISRPIKVEEIRE